MKLYHAAADEALHKLKDSDAPSFREALDESVPGWRNSAIPLAGYSDPRHHVNLPVGRALHDSLPAPFSSAPYEWTQAHGFNAVLSYVDAAGRTKEEVAALIDAAIIENVKVGTDS